MTSLSTMTRWLCLSLLAFVLALTSMPASAQGAAARLPKGFTEKTCLCEYLHRMLIHLNVWNGWSLWNLF